VRKRRPDAPQLGGPRPGEIVRHRLERLEQRHREMFGVVAADAALATSRKNGAMRISICAAPLG
jgi:hypothetical protein